MDPLIAKIGSAAFTKLRTEYEKKRAEAAAEILERKLRRGNYWAVAQDQVFATILRFERAAVEGAARINLELLADAASKTLSEPTFAPNEFLRHADALASLSREEVLVLQAVLNAKEELKSIPRDQEDTGPDGRVWPRARARLAPTAAFPSEDHVTSHAFSLARTGWIVPVSTYGGLTFVASPSLEVIGRLVNVDEALATGSDLNL